MGTDLYYHIERQLEDGSWETVDWRDYDLDLIPRAYVFYGILDGTRHDLPEDLNPIVPEPRGWPPHTRKGRGLTWDHMYGHSWVTADEIREWPGWAHGCRNDNQTYRERAGGIADAVIEVLEKNAPARLYFCYD